MLVKYKRDNCICPFASCRLFLPHPCVSRDGETIVDICRIQSVCNETEGVIIFKCQKDDDSFSKGTCFSCTNSPDQFMSGPDQGCGVCIAETTSALYLFRFMFMAG